MTHKMNLIDKYFNRIKSGTKTIEMRLYDEKRRKIKIGETIEFINRTTGESVLAEVLAMHLFDSFDELYNSFDKISIGYHENEIANPNDMSKFYSSEDIRKYRVVGIELKVKE